MTVSTGIRNVMFQFMVMLAVNHTALICSTLGNTGQWAMGGLGRFVKLGRGTADCCYPDPSSRLREPLPS
jgi:hypothetical protein